MKRKLGYFLSVLLTILLLIWLGSPASLRWYAQAIEMFSDGMVRIENLQGHPLWALHADKIIVQDVDVVVSIYQPQLHWEAWQLLIGRVHIEYAEVSLLDIEMLDIETPTTFELADLNFLRFFEAQNLELKQLTYRDGSTKLTWHQLNASDVSFGRTISGHLFGRYNDRYFQLHLDGGHQQWQAEFHVLHQQETELLLKLRGFAWDQGKLQIQGLHALQVEGRWSHQGEEWLLESETSTNYQKDTADLQWQLHANPVIDHYQLDAHGFLAADWLHETGWPFELHGRWDDKQHMLRLVDQQQTANWLQFDYAQSILKLKLHTENWQIPLQQAYGWLSSDALLLMDLQQDTWQASFHVHDSELAALPLQFQGEVSGKQLNWQIGELSADILGVHLEILGQQQDDQLALRVLAKAQHLKELFTLANMNADASLQAEINVHGEMNQPLLNWEMQFTNISSQDIAMQQLTFSGEAEPAAWLANMQLKTTQLQLGQKLNWQDLALQLEKTAEQVTLSSQAHGDISWILDIQGTQDSYSWHGQLEKLLLQYQGQDILHLKPATWHWQQGMLHIQQSQLLFQKQLGEWQLEADASGPSFQMNLDTLNLAAISHWLPDWTLSGKPTSMNLSIQGLWSQPDIALQVDSQQWVLDDQETAMSFKLKTPQVQFSYNNGTWHWQGKAQMHEHDSLSFKGLMPWQLSFYPWLNVIDASSDLDQTVFKIQMHDLNAWRPLFLPDQEVNLEGDISAQLQIKNAFEQAVFQAKLKANFTHIQIPELGVDLQANMQANWHKEQGDLDLSLKTGEGEAKLHGDLLWPLQRSTLALQLSDFPLMQRNDNTIVADGQLRLSADAQQQIYIAGKLSAKKMVISFPDALPQASEDIVWDDEEKAEIGDSALEAGHLDIQISLAEDAQIVGDGMQMGLQGVLHLGGTLAQPTLTGDILVHDGFFTFRHVELQVQPDSHIIFTGDLSQPSLNIRVAKQQDDMLLGVHISGSTNDMQSVFYSDPAMTQTEILAYIATGKSLGNMEGNDLSVAANVASFFLGSDANPLMKIRDVLQQSFGLDSLDWEVTPSGGRVVAGKRLNKKVKLELEQSLQAEASTALTLEYILVRGLAVFARQISNQAPVFGLRYRKVWNVNDSNQTLKKTPDKR